MIAMHPRTILLANTLVPKMYVIDKEVTDTLLGQYLVDKRLILDWCKIDINDRVLDVD